MVFDHFNNNLTQFVSEATSDKIKDIVVAHSVGAAAGTFAAAVVPGPQVAALLTVISVGVIWSMYLRINSALGIRLGRAILKTLASAVVANIFQALGGTLALFLIGTFIPGLSVVLAPAACYAVVLISGVIYTQMMTELFSANKDVGQMTAEELKDAARRAADGVDIKGAFKEAGNAYKTAYKNGDVTGKETYYHE